MPDEIPDIADALRLAARSADAVLVEGGLGPTSDDVTREVATATGVGLRRDPDVEKRLLRVVRARIVPSSTSRCEWPTSRPEPILMNPRGQAPSLRTTIDGTVVYAVPGVPAECVRL